ncbi:MAG: UbiA family prenyltransferase [Ktedonobacteraceae bacterium]|nr:UbiA family prenyltransferase [Ktedonobacteraceae bacterium]
MTTIRKRNINDIVLGIFLLCHPLPVLFHIIAVTVFALLAAWPHPIWSILVLVIAAHTSMQLAIAVLNDYADRRLDMLSKRDKPIARGLVLPREALILGICLIILMFLLLLPLHPLALLFSVLYLACGLGYNLGLKSTPFSGVVFAIAIPLIPVYAFVGVGRIIPVVFWFIPVAALLGIALNLANSLSDIEEDAANGARTLAVMLGVKGTLTACLILISLALLLVSLLALTHLVVVQSTLLVSTILIVMVLIVSLLVLGRSAQTEQRRKYYFFLVVATCLVLAGGWLLSIFV